MSDSHHHKHHHHDDHAPVEETEAFVSRFEILEIALRELLIEKGIIVAADIPAQIERTESRTPALGAQIIARAWTDFDFRDRLCADPRNTLSTEMEIDTGDLAELVILENSESIHNVVVCTLCSCYPRMILGAPPAWYKSKAYRSRVVRDPRSVLREFGLEITAETRVEVHDSTADLRYLVIPRRPTGTDGWERDALAALVTRDSMIGTGLPQVPQEG